MSKLTEATILQKASVQKLQEVVDLDLSATQVKDIDSSLFNQLVKIESLNLSKNRIHEVPSALFLPALKTLDLSDNTISTLKFLANFPSLETLHVSANPLLDADKHLAVFLAPKLTRLDGSPVSDMKTTVTEISNILDADLKFVWAEHFEDAYEEEEDLSDAIIDVMCNNFIKIMKKQRGKVEEKMIKLYDDMTESLVKTFFVKIRDDSERVERKKRRKDRHGLFCPSECDLSFYGMGENGMNGENGSANPPREKKKTRQRRSRRMFRLRTPSFSPVPFFQ